MRHQKAREMKNGGGWHYTSERNGDIDPIGYCAGPPDYHAMERWIAKAHVDDERKRNAPYLHKYHTRGHATPVEAAECYRQYQLDQFLRLDGALEHTQERCLECQAWTQGVATISIGSRSFVLCDTHRVREIVESHFLPEIESWES